MNTLFAQSMLSMDMVGSFRIAALVIGILLLVIWVVSIKNTTALFYDKKKIRATAIFGAPGLILLLIGIFLIATATPMLSYFYIANYGEKAGKVEVDGNEHVLEAGSWKLIEIRTKDESSKVKGYFGDSIVFDTTMGAGSYIGSLSAAKTIVAEEVEYSGSASRLGTTDLKYEMLMSPGIVQFSDKLISDLYDFDQDAPETMSVSSTTSSVRKFDLSFTSTEAIFQDLLKELGKDGEMDVDSLLDAIGEDTAGTAQEDLLPEGE